MYDYLFDEATLGSKIRNIYTDIIDSKILNITKIVNSCSS